VLPAGHASQVMEPARSAYRPAVQSVHREAPGPLLLRPVAQSVHCEAPESENEPGAQGKQADSPA
jgi:hypothetical protein